MADHDRGGRLESVDAPNGVLQHGLGADERQDDEAGENAEAEHQRTPPIRYQVMSAATPMSMAKA